MVGSNMLLEIHRRLQQIKGVIGAAVFGGVSILWEIYISYHQLFSTVSDCFAQLYDSGSLWCDHGAEPVHIINYIPSTLCACKWCNHVTYII